MLGAETARILGRKRGTEIDLNGRTYAISGVLQSTGSQDDMLIFTSLGEAQSILGQPGRISMAEVAALCHNCPIQDMVQQINAVMPERQSDRWSSPWSSPVWRPIGHFKKFSPGRVGIGFSGRCTGRFGDH